MSNNVHGLRDFLIQYISNTSMFVTVHVINLFLSFIFYDFCILMYKLCLLRKVQFCFHSLTIFSFNWSIQTIYINVFFIYLELSLPFYPLFPLYLSCFIFSLLCLLLQTSFNILKKYSIPHFLGCQLQRLVLLRLSQRVQYHLFHKAKALEQINFIYTLHFCRVFIYILIFMF